MRVRKTDQGRVLRFSQREMRTIERARDILAEAQDRLERRMQDLGMTEQQIDLAMDNDAREITEGVFNLNNVDDVRWPEGG